MLFIFGITQGIKELGSGALVICQKCGSYCRYAVFMTYNCLSLFFVPVFKWNKRYFVRSSCCSTVYGVDKELAYAVLDGENVTIDA